MAVFYVVFINYFIAYF